MKILLAVDNSPASQAAVDEVAARPWPAGSHVEAHGLRFFAEAATGRRNKIESVLVTKLVGDGARASE